jgi:hypothetical protein
VSSVTGTGERRARPSTAASSPAFGQDGGMDAACELPQFVERPGELGRGGPEQLLGAVGIVGNLAAGKAQGERQRDETLLGAVVEVPLELVPRTRADSTG